MIIINIKIINDQKISDENNLIINSSIESKAKIIKHKTPSTSKWYNYMIIFSVRTTYDGRATQNRE